MIKRSSLFFALLSIVTPACAQSVPGVLDEADILRAVEQNSPALLRASATSQAESVQARTGNSLSDPELGYTHTWGPSSAAGENEYTVTQGFDFPTVYVQRARIARTKEHIAQTSYRAVRMEVLLKARLAVRQILYLQQRIQVDSLRLADALFARQIALRRAQAGDITSIEENRIEFQTLSARNNLARVRVALQAAVTELSILSGLPAAELTAIGAMPVPPLPPLEQVLEKACVDDPQLCCANAGQDAALAERRLAVSKALPRFSAGYKHSTSDGLRFNGVVVGMSVPLFESRNTVRLARLRQQEAQALAHELETGLRAEITARYRQAQQLESLFASYRQVGSWDEKSVLLRKALDGGTMSILEYFTQLDTVYRGMDEENELVYNYHSLLIELGKYTL